MNQRWLNRITKFMPTVDLIDLSAETFPFNSIKRQFSPANSQLAYETMLHQEYAIGDYLTNPKCSLDITPFARS